MDDSHATISNRRSRRWRLALCGVVLAIGAASAGAYYGANQFRGGQAAAPPATSCETERDAMKARSDEIEAMLAKVEGNIGASVQELEDLRTWQRDAARRTQTVRDLSQKLQKLADGGVLVVRVRDGRLVLRLPEDQLFVQDVTELSREGELALMEIAIILRQFPDRRFMVVGHTDDQEVKTSRYNTHWEVSMARALVVVLFLIESNVNPRNLVPAGHGEYDPIATNKTPAGQRENRRIEIVLQPEPSELP